ncbi:hypothetical protein [Nocardia inohanensis]|uniref:hypothetical protein n=1 Tax=Nocardia inohanensis TaxID=209246 RepID=UPI0008334190|nr:hypothetical protein [Nocardia inohanensis]
MNLRSLLHRKTETVPLLPADEAPPPPGRTAKSRTNGALEEKLERLLTPGELDLVQHHRI